MHFKAVNINILTCDINKLLFSLKKIMIVFSNKMEEIINIKNIYCVCVCVCFNIYCIFI